MEIRRQRQTEHEERLDILERQETGSIKHASVIQSLHSSADIVYCLFVCMYVLHVIICI